MKNNTSLKEKLALLDNKIIQANCINKSQNNVIKISKSEYKNLKNKLYKTNKNKTIKENTEKESIKHILKQFNFSSFSCKKETSCKHLSLLGIPWFHCKNETMQLRILYNCNKIESYIRKHKLHIKHHYLTEEEKKNNEIYLINVIAMIHFTCIKEEIIREVYLNKDTITFYSIVDIILHVCSSMQKSSIGKETHKRWIHKETISNYYNKIYNSHTFFTNKDIRSLFEIEKTLKKI